MAARINQSIQNTLWLLNPLHHPLTSKLIKPTLHFRPNPLFSSSSRSQRALFCTCTSSSSDKNLQDGGEPFVLTTPLYYVNAPPHMGSAYTTIAADAIARFQRLLGKKVVFITGTDEHGEKIATAAAARGSDPSEHCDVISEAYKTLWKDLDISYDKFIRTTELKHEAIVKEFYSRVLANGDIYRADYEGLYCVNCEEYKDEKELLDNNCCPMHLKPCVLRKEDNYFFALSKYQKLLEETLTQNPNFVQPSYRLNEVRYVSALSEGAEQPNLQSAVSSGWPASLHLIGKDILRFHAVYWPAMLMSAGLSLPKMVFGHGFLTKDGMKMGKSLGNTLEPNDLVHKFGPDAVRYFFIREVEFGNDGDYSEDRFINIVNAHLANTIGNLLNRTLGLLKKNCQSTLVVDSIIAVEGNAFQDTVQKLVEKAQVNYENLSLSSACEAILEIGNAGNSYMDERAPWSLFKKGAAASEAAAKDLVIILEALRIIAIALSPVTPSLSWRIYAQLGFSKDQFDTARWSETKWGGLKGGQVMAQPKPIFARIENRVEEEDGGEAAKKVVKNKDKVPQAQGVAEA
uniref:methionine--tRNA ligase n=1 Tax=Fagus sylvatica TaxID=28930 RepID=A0A2N9JBV8_FAGSY